MTVHQITEEFETLQVTCLCHQGAVSFIKFLIYNVWSFSTEIVVVTNTVMVLVTNYFTTIYGRYISTRRDIAIEHTVHHHSPDIFSIQSIRGIIIVSHNTALVASI